MKKRNKIIVAAVTGIVLVTGIAACGHHRSPEERADYMVEKITSNLELTAPQVTQLEQLKDELMKARQSMLAERESMHKEVTALLSQPTLDQERALKLVHDQTESVNQKAPQLVSAFAGFYDSLTPEQQTKLREKVEEYRHDHGYWRH